MESNNLLTFVNNVSSNIQVALDKATPKKRRHVTVKKFVENRVKRLDSSRKPVRPNNPTLTKSKSAQFKPAAPIRANNVPSVLVHSCTWPEITTIPSPMPVQTVGLTTCALPTTTPTSLYSSSEPNLCVPVSSSQNIDPELESLLSEFESPSVPLSRRGSFESVCTASSCTPPLNTLEAQMYLGEQPYSPYSDYSDELDSAYCSPESARVNYNCSPSGTPPMPDWSASDLLPPMNTTCLQEPEVRCDWVSNDSPLSITSTASSIPIYDQGPPMTPTVSQLLEQYGQY